MKYARAFARMAISATSDDSPSAYSNSVRVLAIDFEGSLLDARAFAAVGKSAMSVLKAVALRPSQVQAAQHLSRGGRVGGEEGKKQEGEKQGGGVGGKGKRRESIGLKGGRWKKRGEGGRGEKKKGRRKKQKKKK